MSDPRRRRCTCCGKHMNEVGPISWRGNCRPCGQILLRENIIGIAERTGPAYKRRLRGYAKFVERKLVDEVTASP